MKRSSQRQEEARELVAVLEIRKKNKKHSFYKLAKNK
jgi:hypothetical protein